MIDRILTGSRCRILRHVPYPGGSIQRHSLGTIRYGLENLGRQLVMVDWDMGKATLVFPNEIELIEPALAEAS